MTSTKSHVPQPAHPSEPARLSAALSTSKTFIRNVIGESIGRIIGTGLFWMVGFVVAGFILSWLGKPADGWARMAQLSLRLMEGLLLASVGLVSGVCRGLGNALARQIEATEQAIAALFDVVIERVTSRVQTTASMTKDQFLQLFNRQTDDMIAEAQPKQRGFAARVSSWMLTRWLQLLRSVVMRRFLSGRDSNSSVNLSEWVTFMKQSALTLVFSTAKGRVAWLQWLPLIVAALCFGPPILWTLAF